MHQADFVIQKIGSLFVGELNRIAAWLETWWPNNSTMLTLALVMLILAAIVPRASRHPTPKDFRGAA